MALNTLKCNHLMPLPFKGLIWCQVNGGEWQLGDIMCDTWVALDVMCCTASILNLAAIGVDRYVTVLRHFLPHIWITQTPTDYNRYAMMKTGSRQTRQSCLVANSVHTADTDKTRQDTVLSSPCRRCEQALTFNINNISLFLSGTVFCIIIGIL